MTQTTASPLGGFLKPSGFAGPSGVLALVRETSAVTELARGIRELHGEKAMARRAPVVSAGRERPREPVLLVPGFLAGDWSLRQMAARMRLHGERTYSSSIAVNAGCTQRAGERLERRVEAIALRRDSRVRIVGHSLGGMLARGLAARRPDLVAGIVTLGSPVLAPGAVHQVLAWDTELLTRLNRIGLGALMSDDCVAGECARESWEQITAPMDEEIGYTAIYSRRDGVVDPNACLDPFAQRHIEVRASHCGMAVDPKTFSEVLAALAEQRVRTARTAATRHESVGSLHAVNT